MPLSFCSMSKTATFGSPGLNAAHEAAGLRWLVRAQHPNGGWGGAPGLSPTIEETALAVSALATHTEAVTALTRGAEWLASALASGAAAQPAIRPSDISGA